MNRPPRETSAGESIEPLRVLIVEDSEDDALMMADTLREGGYHLSSRRVAAAADMRAALAGAHWDLILSDYNVPGFGALEAFAIYREQGLDVPFLIVSGAIGEETAVAAMKAGVHDFISKNNTARLVPAVRRELLEAGVRRAHARAEADLHGAYAELAAIHAQVPVLMLVVDENLHVQRANELAARFAGRPTEELLGLTPGDAIRCLNALADPCGCGGSPDCPDCPLRLTVLDTLLTGARHDNVEQWLTVSMDGCDEVRCLLVSSALMREDSPKKALVCALDVTELKQTQLALERANEQLLASNSDLDRGMKELRSALADKEVLFKEVQHRVKNNLQVISSLFSLQAEQCRSEEARTVLADSRDRVRAMALVHEQLSFHGLAAEIDFAQYAGRLARYLLESYLAQPARIRVESAVDVTLPLDQSVPCGLILQELISNSLKYAFAKDAPGEIHIELHAVNGENCLRYWDNGMGLPDGFDLRQAKSLGMQLVSDLTAQLAGQLEHFNREGAHFHLTFPARAK